MSKTTILVLDYNKPVESELLLNSIKAGCQFDYELIYLSNGGEQEYVFDFYKRGLIDKLIINKKNTGCGNGTVELFKHCSTKYAFYIQNDQILNCYITKKHIEGFINILENRYYNYRCVDLAGKQAGENNFSERAHFIDVDFYKNIPKGIENKYGGPGPFNYNKYVEQYVQEFFKQNKCHVFHTIPMFIDNGQTSIREIGDGKYIHTCDTKVLKVLKQPTYKTDVYPPLNDSEWECLLAGNWPPEGKIPEQWKAHSFKVWN